MSNAAHLIVRRTHTFRNINTSQQHKYFQLTKLAEHCRHASDTTESVQNIIFIEIKSSGHFYERSDDIAYILDFAYILDLNFILCVMLRMILFK